MIGLSAMNVRVIAQALNMYISFFIAYTVSSMVSGYFQSWVARKMGDRIKPSLDPLDYIDPLGFLAMCICYFGWSKTIPIDPLIAYRYRYPTLAWLVLYLSRAVAYFFIVLISFILAIVILDCCATTTTAGALVLGAFGSAKKVALLLLYSIAYFSLVQMIMAVLYAVCKVIYLKLNSTSTYEMHASVYLALLLFPLIFWGIFGEYLFSTVLKLFFMLGCFLKSLIGAV